MDGASFATYLILFGAKRQTEPSRKTENTLSSLQIRQLLKILSRV